MKNNEFTFLIPNTTWFGKRYWHNFPYTEALLSAVLKEKGYEVNIIDANINDLDEKALEEKLREVNPQILGIGEMSLEYKDCVHKSFEIAKRVNPEIVTIAGGIYPTLSPEIATKDKNIDYIVLGEGEQRLPTLIDAIQHQKGFEKIDGLIHKKDGKIVEQPIHFKNAIDLNSLPLPDYSNFDMKRYMNYQQKFTQNFRFKQLPVAITMTSRGCKYKCSFCSSKELYSQKIRTMNPERVLKEVDMLTEKYGAKELIFIDDSLLWPRDRALEIMDGLIERKRQGKETVWKSNNLALHDMDDEILDKMKESGCYQVIVSIESGSPATLKRMRKPINLEQAVKTLEKVKQRKFDDVSSNFVIGMPGDSWEDIRESINFADRMVDRGLLHYVVFHIATPFPKTELYDICREKRYIPEGFSFEDPQYYGFGKGVISTPEFTPDKLQVLRAYEWDRINFKTLEQRTKVAKMVGISLEELEKWRKDTINSAGLHVKFVDERAK